MIHLDYDFMSWHGYAVILLFCNCLVNASILKECFAFISVENLATPHYKLVSRASLSLCSLLGKKISGAPLQHQVSQAFT
jgi:hypothetical protein